jgi:hypothetical protein
VGVQHLEDIFSIELNEFERIFLMCRVWCQMV